MSASVDLQTLVYDRLIADAAVAAIVGSRVYDNVPSDAQKPYISFGPSDYRPDDADCIRARTETLQVDCWTADHGKKRPCKILADAVKAALHEYEVELSGDNALVEMIVAQVRILDDPDGITTHGVVQVEATIEEG